jgi:hypothetical protein
VFATAKVYSPQYALWIFAALALIGAPLRLAVAFGLVDVLIFTTTFGPLYPGFGPFSPGGVPLEIQWAAYGLRQVLTAALAAWVVRELLLGGGRAMRGGGSQIGARLGHDGGRTALDARVEHALGDGLRSSGAIGE